MLARDGVLFGVVEHFLREGWSPGQIAGAMQMNWPDAPARRVAAETIYTCRYALPRGALRQEPITCLRKACGARLPRSRGTDRRGQRADRLSIHVRPPAVEERALPGHWAGDFIKGVGNRSAVGVLVERSSRLVLLAKMADAAAAALEGYTRQLNRIAAPMRPSLTYDRGKEMARRAELTAQTGVKVNFCDPHSPGNADSARTPTASFASTCRMAPTCPSTARNNSMRSPSDSTSGHGRSTATFHRSASTGPSWSILTSPRAPFTDKCCN